MATGSGTLPELLIEGGGSLLNYVLLRSGLKEITESKLKGLATPPSATEDELIWLMTLNELSRLDRADEERLEKEKVSAPAKAEPGAAESKPADGSIVRERPLTRHEYASLLIAKLRKSEADFFRGMLQTSYKLTQKKSEPKEKDKGGVASDAAQPTAVDQVGLDRCVHLLEELRALKPDLNDAVAYLREQRLVQKDVWDKFTSIEWIERAVKAFENISFEEFKRAIRNWPRDITSLEEMVEAIEGWTVKLRRATAARREKRIAAEAKERETPRLQRRWTWTVAMFLGICLIVTGIVAMVIHVEPRSALSNPQHFSDNISSYLDSTASGASQDQQGLTDTAMSHFRRSETWLALLGLALVLAARSRIKSIAKREAGEAAAAAAEQAKEAAAAAPQMKKVKVTKVTTIPGLYTASDLRITTTFSEESEVLSPDETLTIPDEEVLHG